MELRRITAIHVCQYSVSSNLWNKRPASFIDLTAHLQIVTWIRMRPGIGRSPWADGANIVLEVRLHFIRSLDFPRFSSIDESYPTTYLSHIPQCTIQNRTVHISVLNGVLWDKGKVCRVCEIGLLQNRKEVPFHRLLRRNPRCHPLAFLRAYTITKWNWNVLSLLTKFKKVKKVTYHGPEITSCYCCWYCQYYSF